MVVSEGVAEARSLRDRFERHEPGDDRDAVQTRLEQWGLDLGSSVDETPATAWAWMAAARWAPSGAWNGEWRGPVAQPEVLLLDEPTNHLDLDAITWLEELLNAFAGSLLLITHDRAFLDRVCNRIVELTGACRGFTRQLQRLPESQRPSSWRTRPWPTRALTAAGAGGLDPQGREARRTRSVARVARLVEMRQQHQARRDVQGKVRPDLDRGESSGKIVAELEGVSKVLASAPSCATSAPPSCAATSSA